MLNLENLVKGLLKQDLNRFQFTIFSRETENNEIKYTYTPKGSVPMEDFWSLVTSIGGNSDIKYDKEYIMQKLN